MGGGHHLAELNQGGILEFQLPLPVFRLDDSRPSSFLLTDAFLCCHHLTLTSLPSECFISDNTILL